MNWHRAVWLVLIVLSTPAEARRHHRGHHHAHHHHVRESSGTERGPDYQLDYNSARSTSVVSDTPELPQAQGSVWGRQKPIPFLGIGQLPPPIRLPTTAGDAQFLSSTQSKIVGIMAVAVGIELAVLGASYDRYRLAVTGIGWLKYRWLYLRWLMLSWLRRLGICRRRKGFGSLR
jgi:hypothetical protein